MMKISALLTFFGLALGGYCKDVTTLSATDAVKFPLQDVLRLRGSGTGARAEKISGVAGGAHSSVFLDDTRQRQGAGKKPCPTLDEGIRSGRSAQDILEGAIQREEGRRVHANSQDTCGGLSVKELKLRLRDLGVPQETIDACYERAHLEDLLKEKVRGFGQDAQQAHAREDASDTSDEAAMRKAAASLDDPVKGLLQREGDEEESEDQEERDHFLDHMMKTQESKADQAFIERLQQTGRGSKPKKETLRRPGHEEEAWRKHKQKARSGALLLDSGESSEEEACQVDEIDSAELGPAIEIREGLPEDVLTEDGKVKYAVKNNKAGYDARAVSDAQSLFEARMGSYLPEEEKVLVERNRLLQQQSVGWLRSELLSLNVDLTGLTEKWELVGILRSHPRFDWTSVPGFEEASKKGIDLKGSQVGANSTENERYRRQPLVSQLPDKLEAYDSSESSSERRRYAHILPSARRKRRAAEEERAEEEAAEQGDLEAELKRESKRFKGVDLNADTKRQFAETIDPMGYKGKIRVHCNDRLGWKTSVLVRPSDTIGRLKVLLAQKMAKNPKTLRLQKWDSVYKDHITLSDYEIHDGFNMELYYETGAMH